MRELRKRKSLDKEQRRKDDIEEFKRIASRAERICVFSGSGLSAAAGLSTFTSRGGLYERATKRFKVKDGMKLFCNSFYRRKPKECRAIMSDIYFEALKAEPTSSHRALARLEVEERLVRHYTMNVDGLHRFVEGATTWTGEKGCAGKTVELHGSCRETLCTNFSCGGSRVSQMTLEQGHAFRKGKEVLCTECSGEIRPKVMLYDDGDSEFITPDVVMEVMDEDIAKSDLILWIGISFQQSASLEYFRNAQRVLKESCGGRAGEVTQAIINPDPDSWFNCVSGASGLDDMKIISVVSDSNTVLAGI
ncbi:DHS-like NAD/FAD-binding domain-containing protein [Chloropicon primus]|uniref:DHS-like NAD/FAD-binding domain-containing protein n=1 Tax=Chloropicon primus TaxID=1764295 RepID=A0A5B8MF40_9CHLO|nr:DHS-like NAD/FAD-binding domain-containing protein [Chloropicon primus]UPQ97177.1 DHS-like NAD/FAD-binding domain-containing protein [Chloropicon primus]|eukprot:QDZ17962.1 DHS-like NAD/FAD-binding domain-containing protein [Chloropicon primus]